MNRRTSYAVARPLAVVPCAGVPITACTREEAADEVVRLAASGLDRGIAVHLCNAYTLALADLSSDLKALLRGGGLNFPDGKSVVWANRLRHGRSLPEERVYGPDLMLDVVRLGLPLGLRHYLLGSTPPVLASLEHRLRERCPGLLVVGAESPPFGPLDDETIAGQAARIRASGADVVWVGLGTPKQDEVVERLATMVPAVYCAVGAAFDFISGHKRQAPVWMQRRGLEWVFRLMCEPRRLWRRYLFGNARFVRAALRGAG